MSVRPIDADALKASFEEDGHLSGYIEEYIDYAPTLDLAPKWISVKDRLPEDRKKILVVNGHGYTVFQACGEKMVANGRGLILLGILIM